MHLGNDNTFFNLNLGENIINLSNTSDSLDTDYSENPRNLTYMTKSLNIPDQEKGLLEKEPPNSKNESASLLLNKNIPDEVVEKKDLSKSNFEIETKSKSTLKLKHYGNIMPLLFNKEGEPILVIGPHQGPFFLCLFTIFALISFLFMYFLWERIHWIVKGFGILIILSQNFLYLFTSLSNPGLPKASYQIEVFEDPTRNFRQCKDCKLWINTEERTFHCHDCGICIEGFDHHCPWTSKCIGKGNLVAFYLFILFTFLFFVYIIICASFIDRSNNPNSGYY